MRDQEKTKKELLAELAQLRSQLSESAVPEKMKSDFINALQFHPPQEVFDLMPQPIFWKDKNSRYVGSNQAFLNLLGLNSVTEIAGRTDADLSIQFSFEPAWKPEEVVEKDKISAANLSVDYQKNRKTSHLTVKEVPWHDQAGNMIGVFGIVKADAVTINNINTQKSKQAYFKLVNMIVTNGSHAADLDQFLQMTLPEIMQLTGFEMSGIYLINEEIEAAQLHCGLGPLVKFLENFSQIPIREYPHSLLYETGKPVFIEDFRKFDPQIAKDWGLLSASIIPLFSKEKVIGSLNLANPRPHSFSQREKDFFLMLGTELGIIIRRFLTEDALQKNEKKYRQIVENINDGFVLHNYRGKIKEVNERIATMVGASCEALIGRFMTEFIHPDHLKNLIKKFKSLATKKSFILDTLLLGENGKLLAVNVSTTFISREGEGLLQSLVRDLTEHRKVETALRDSETRFRSVVENSQVGILIIDSNSNFVYVNDLTCQILGYSRDELLHQSFKPIIHEPDRKMVENYFLRRQRGEEAPSRYEFTIQRRDGQNRLIEITVGVIKDEKRKIRTIAQISDITERKQAEIHLQETKARLEYVLTSSPVIIYTCRPTGSCEITFISENVLEQLGYPAEKFLKQPGFWKTLVHPDDQPNFILGQTRVLLKDHFVTEYRIKVRNSQYRWIRDESNLIRNENYDPVEVIGCWIDITERRIAEEALKNSEERLNILFQFAPDAYYLNDLQGNLVDANKTAEELLGYDKKELIGQKLFNSKIIPLEESAIVLRELAINSVGLPSGPVEITLIKKDQTKIPVEVRTFPVKINDKPLVLGSARDISERKAAEKVLKRHLLAMSSSMDGMAILDKNEKYIYLNQAHAEVYGYQNYNELLGKSWRILYDENELHRFDTVIFPEFLMSGRWRGEAVGTRKDGSKFPQEISLNALPDGGLICVVRDITSRKQAEQEVEHEKQRLFSVLDRLPVYVCLIAPDMSIPFVNKKFRELFGVPGKHKCFTALRQKSELCANCPVVKARETRQTQIREWQSADGHIYLIYCYLFPMANESKMTLEVGIDITESRKAEVALKHARDAAESANSAKSKFLANMSHEIRTPMNGIIGLTELVQNTNLNSEQTQYLKMLKNSATQLLDLLNDILDFSKIEAGQISLDRVEFDIIRAIESISDVVINHVEDKALDLNIFIQQNIPLRMIGDLGKLRQVLLNLVFNAIKFTEEGEITIKVELLRKTEQQVVLHFTVQDTGIGIARERQKAIFESFTQADSSTTRKYGGTGLGLAISQKLVEIMNGKIWLESQKNQGSRFHFTASFKLPDSKSKISGWSSPIEKENILVITQNSSINFILGEILKTAKCLSKTIENAEEGVELLAGNHGFSSIILDYDTLEGDEIRILSEIRQKNKSLPIICLTTLRKYKQVQQLEKMYAVWPLTKPIKQSQLTELFKSIYESNTISQPAQAFRMSPIKEIDYLAELQKLEIKYPILLAEDNLVNQKVAVALVQRSGIEVEVVADGLLAFEALSNKKYALILMDVQMPNMDGLTATKKIRSEFSHLQIPIIAMTAHAMKGDKETCLVAGMNAYITKPIVPEEFYKILWQWLK